eukprot:scpid48335/ scgid5222/ 
MEGVTVCLLCFVTCFAYLQRYDHAAVDVCMVCATQHGAGKVFASVRTGGQVPHAVKLCASSHARMASALRPTSACAIKAGKVPVATGQSAKAPVTMANAYHQTGADVGRAGVGGAAAERYASSPVTLGEVGA